jgi:hypothetical protein
MNSVRDDPIRAGFPHSDICGSKGARASPQLFAACHVLHRLSVPRHPPNALLALDCVTRHAQTQKPVWMKMHRTAGMKHTFSLRIALFRNARAQTSHIFSATVIGMNKRHGKSSGQAPSPSHKSIPDLKRLATYSHCHRTKLSAELSARRRRTQHLLDDNFPRRNSRRPQNPLPPAGNGGADRVRTGDLLLAKQALSQLSYGPGRGWWAREDLNFRPHAYQARALTN